MSWDDFESDLMALSEIETTTETDSVPQTIQRYQQRIQSNNTASIFDADFSLPNITDEDQLSSSSLENIRENGHEDLLKDEAEVTKVICGRGRGGRNVFHKPGVLTRTKFLDDDEDVIQQIRKVAPIGYGNEITEIAVRAHHKAKLVEQEKSVQSSPAVSKFSSPSTFKVESPVKPKKYSELETRTSSSSRETRPTTSYLPTSEYLRPSSRSTDSSSSDYFTSLVQNINPTSPHKFENSNGRETHEKNDSESDEQENTETEVAKPIPMSELLRQSRLKFKQLQQERQRNDELATQLKIEEILQQDRLEEELRKVRYSDQSSGSSVTSASSREDTLTWRQRTNSPPRYAWQQNFRRKDRDMLNIGSILDFPPLK